MTRVARIAAAALFASCASASLSPLALAQTAAQVAISEKDVIGAYRVLGVVEAKYHQKSLFPSKSPQASLDDALRVEAAKLGADAVIQVRYSMVNAMQSKDGHSAVGVAVKFDRAPATTTAGSAPAVAPPVQFGPTSARPAEVAAAPTATPPAPPTIVAALPPAPQPPVSAPQTVQPPAAVASTPPALTAVPMMSPAGPPSALASATAPVAAPLSTAPRPATADMVMLSEQDIINQGYEKLGDVTVRYHQKSLFPKNPPKVEMENMLKAEGFKLGADAVIMVKYNMVNAMQSKDGHSATGIAVRVARAPVMAMTTPTAAAVVPAAPVAAAPSVALAAAPAAPVATAAPVSVPTARSRPLNADMVMLSEQDIINQGYEKLGDVQIRYHQKSLFPKNPPRVEMEKMLKAEAFKMGADAVILVKYNMVNAMQSKDGHLATGVAVKLK